jgi:tripeptide aminopeptidase
MRPASDVERRHLNDTFARLCAIPSPFGSERAMADAVARELGAMGVDVEEDGVAAEVGAQCGNLLARIPGRDERTILLCAHLDTVPEPGVIEPVLDDGGWVSRGDTILGADNKAAVAVILEVARRCAVEGSPVGLELLFTVCEEVGLVGAKAFDVRTLRSDWGYVFDHASPIGEIIVASPTYYRFQADFRGTPAHAGIRPGSTMNSPEDGRSAIEAAARAVAAMTLGRIDEETTANIGRIEGGQSGGTNIVAARCNVLGEVRSLDPSKAEDVIAQVIARVHDAANTPACFCDVDVTTERLFDGYRHAPNAPAVLAAEQALRACGYAPRHRATGGGSDANAFEANGFHCANLANGTERNHEPDERVSVAALEGMLDVTYALLDACSA